MNVSEKLEQLKLSGKYNDGQLKVFEDALSKGYDTKIIENENFNLDQMQELLLAKYDNRLKDHQLMVLSNSLLSAGQMREVRLGYHSGIEAGTYAFPGFNEAQMKVLRISKMRGVDTESFQTAKHNAMQMYILSEAALSHIPQELFIRVNDTRYNAAQMEVMLEAAMGGKDLSKYVNEDMSPEKMRFISHAMDKGLKGTEIRQIASIDTGYGDMQRKLDSILRSRERVSLFVDLKFGTLLRNFLRRTVKNVRHSLRNAQFISDNKLTKTANSYSGSFTFNSRQLDVLEEAANLKIDLKEIANPALEPEKMRLLMEGKAKGIDISKIANPELNAEQIVLCLREMKKAQTAGYDITPAITSKLHVSQMAEYFHAAENGLDISKMIDPGDTPDAINEERKMMEAELMDAVLEPSEGAQKDGRSSLSEELNSEKNQSQEKDTNKEKQTVPTEGVFKRSTEGKIPIDDQIASAEAKLEEQIQAKEQGKDVSNKKEVEEPAI